MKKSLVDSNKTVSPFRSPEQETHNRSYQFSRAKYTEVTIQTFDKDVPFIAIYKPDINAERRRTQAITKMVGSLLSFEKMRAAYSISRLFMLGPKEKSLNIKTLYFGCLFERLSSLRKFKGMKALVVNKLKKSGNLTAAKIVWKIQHSILNRNIQTGLSQIRRNRLLMMVKQLSDGNELAGQLKRTREELSKKEKESFSRAFIQKCKKLQKMVNKDSFIELMTQQNYSNQLKNQAKRFEEIRNNGFPKKKDLFQNESVIAVFSNILQSYEGSIKDYQSYCEQLKTQLTGYKDAEGIQQLKQTINQKDIIIRDVQAFVNELGRMDTQLKKFTAQNKFMADRVSSTIQAHDKKLQQKAKTLQGLNSKLMSSRTYLNSVTAILLRKYEGSQKQIRVVQQQNKDSENSKIIQIADFQREVSSLKNQLELQKGRLIALLQKKQSRSGLIDLKRKWKVNDELKSLLDYVANLHQQIESLKNEKRQIQSSLSKQKAQIHKRDKLSQISKKIEMQQTEVLKVEKQLQFKSKSLEKEKIELTKKWQREQSDISRIQNQLLKKTETLDYERQQHKKKEEQLHSSITKLSKFIRKSLEDAKHEGIVLESQIGHDITDTLGPIVTPVQQLVDLINKLKLDHKTEHERYPQLPQKHTQGLSLVESQVKLYRPEVNIDEFQKEIAHRLFSHLQAQLEAKQTQIIRSNKETIEKLKQQRTSTNHVSEMKCKMQLLQKQLEIKSNSDELLLKAVAKINELENIIRQLQKAIHDLKQQNQDLSLKIQELKTYYQQQVTVIKDQFTQTANFIGNQYSQKLGGFTSQQSSNSRLISQKHQQILSKQHQIQEEIYNLRSQLLSNIAVQQTQSLQPNRYNEQLSSLKLHTSQLQNQLARRNNQNQRTQNRLKQTQQALSIQRQKVISLQADLVKIQQLLGRSHKESDKLALETHDQVKKVKLVLHALEEELDKKTKLAETAQSKSTNLQKTIMRLESELFNSQQQLKEAIRFCSVLQQRNMQINSELTHLKTQFFSIQIELQNNRNTKLYTNSQLSSLQNELKEKQNAINNILQQSKSNSTTLNSQLFQTREQLVIQQRKFEEQLAVKSALINRLQHQLTEHENTVRNLEQKCMLFQQNHKRAEYQIKNEGYDIKDRQIQLLKQQIASLQEFLADISHQYKQLQIKYHQQKLKFGGSPIQKLHNHQLEHSMQVIDRAINQLSDNAPFSEQVRSLIYNNQRLQTNIEELQQERFKLLQKAKSLPERQYVVQLVFNVLLGARGTAPQSTKGNAIWNELLKINEKCGDVGELFTQLQRFSLCELNNKL